MIPRGTRHAIANESGESAHVLGMWSPDSALRYVTDMGAALPASGHPNLGVLTEFYQPFHSELDVWPVSESCGW